MNFFSLNSDKKSWIKSNLLKHPWNSHLGWKHEPWHCVAFQRYSRLNLKSIQLFKISLCKLLQITKFHWPNLFHMAFILVKICFFKTLVFSAHLSPWLVYFYLFTIFYTLRKQLILLSFIDYILPFKIEVVAQKLSLQNKFSFSIRQCIYFEILSLSKCALKTK